MKIFIVDDDTEQRMIMADHLSNPDDSVSEFTNGKEFLAALGEPPDLILLDIEMPEMDGISACRTLREMGHTHTQVIFISAHDDLQTRLAAYAAGGSDFMVKPFIPVDLLGKVEVARSLMARQASFASDIQIARQTAFTAMSSMGELGVVLQFLRTSFACTTPDSLAQALIDALNQYGLIGTFELRTGAAKHVYASHGECSPLERSVLSHAQSMERIFCFHSHMAVNYPNVTLVVRNLPDDEERIGRLRDHLAALIEGTDARVLALQGEVLRLEQSQAILENTKALTKALTSIDRQQTENRNRLLALGVDYLEELSRAYTGLGLSAEQETRLSAMAQRATDRIGDAIGDSTDIATQLRTVAIQLKKLV